VTFIYEAFVLIDLNRVLVYIDDVDLLGENVITLRAV
jgi:hypothetical protein